MKFLLINSNDNSAFIALYSNDKLHISYASDFLTAEERISSHKKPDKLIHCLDKIANENSINDFDAVSVTIGPGSFTGIRVGLSIAKGLANALDKKIIPVNNFELSLNRLDSLQPGITYCILIKAKSPEYYYTVIKNGEQLKTGCTELTNLSSIIDNNAIIVGNFDNETQIKHSYFNLENDINLKSEQDSMLELTKRFYTSGRIFTSDKIEPVYIKDFRIKHQTQN